MPGKNAAYWLCAHPTRTITAWATLIDPLFLLESAYLHEAFSGESSHMSGHYTPNMNRTDIAGLFRLTPFSLITVILSIEACAMPMRLTRHPIWKTVSAVLFGTKKNPGLFLAIPRWTAGAPDESRVRSIQNITPADIYNPRRPATLGRLIKLSGRQSPRFICWWPREMPCWRSDYGDDDVLPRFWA